MEWFGLEHKTFIVIVAVKLTVLFLNTNPPGRRNTGRFASHCAASQAATTTN